MQQITRPSDVDEKIVAIDIETESLTDDPDDALNPYKNKITLIAISDGDQINKVFKDVNDAEHYIVLLTQNKCKFTFHNGKFDLRNLVVHGFNKHLAFNIFDHDSNLLAFTSQDKIPDTWLDQYEQDRVAHNKLRTGMKHRKAGPHSLKTLAPYFLGIQPFWEPEGGHNNEEYAIKDAAYTARLTRYFLKTLPEKSLDFYNNQFLPWTRMLLEMELDGINIDLELLKKKWMESDTRASKLHGEMITEWREHLKAFVIKEQNKIVIEWTERQKSRKRPPTEKQAARANDSLSKQLYEVGTLNFDSPSQLKWLLQERLGYDVVNLDGDESTGKEVLTRLAEQDKTVKKLLEYRKLRKLSSSFFPEYRRIQVNGKIHTNFNVTSTRTGRLSSSGPNLQQVPGHLHDLFIPEQGKVFITKDLSAIEPTILAYYSEDEELCKLMIDGIRFHSVNAITMFELDCSLAEVKSKFPLEDKVAKTVGLAILYGAGANRVYQTLQQFGMSEYTLGDARRFVDRIRERYNGVWKFKQELDRVLESGEVVYNLLGRPLSIKDSQDVYIQGLNSLIQSSASDLLISRVNDIRNKNKELKVKLLVHDEVVFEVEKTIGSKFEELISKELINYELLTQYGNIPIKSEGKLALSWEK